MADLRLNYNTSQFRVCMDTKSSGRLVAQRLRAAIPFSDLPDMLLKADIVMDAQDHPRAFQRKRQFVESSADSSIPYAREPEEMMSAEAVENESGALATLQLQVTTRQNASWQGALSVVGKDERHTFESVLQLLALIDELTEV